jgi:hypothetical protein
VVFTIFVTRGLGIYVVAEMDIRRTVRCEIREQWRKIGIYAIKYKEKLERIVRNREVKVKLSLCLTN